MSTEHIEEHQRTQTEGQKTIKGPNLGDEVDYYDDPRDEEEADREYREKMALVIAKAVEKETIANLAMDLYNDYDFYPDIFRPHITVWIKWFERYYKWDWDKAYYSQQQIEADLRWISHMFDEMQRKRAIRLVLEKSRCR